MKLNYELSKLALADIDNIWQYTFKNWSKTQANEYYKDIFKEIEIICENPEIGKSIKDIKPNHRIQLIKSHIIVYKVLEAKIYIDRILHKRMDIQNILSK